MARPGCLLCVLAVVALFAQPTTFVRGLMRLRAGRLQRIQNTTLSNAPSNGDISEKTLLASGKTRHTVRSNATAGDAHTFLQQVFGLTYGCKKAVRVPVKHGDGGYVVCEDAGPFTPRRDQNGGCTLYSYGIADDDKFEQEVRAQYGCRVEEFDPTVPGSHGSKQDPTNIRFHHEGIGEAKMSVPDVGPVDTVEHHLAEFGRPGKFFALKVDVEGSEFSALPGVSDAFWEQTDLLILELHNNNWYFQGLSPPVELLAKVHQHFFLFHVHANKCCMKLDVAGVSVPECVELSFIRKGLVTAPPAGTAIDGHPELDAIEQTNSPCPQNPPLPTGDFYPVYH